MVALIWLWLAFIVASFLPLIDGGVRMIWMVLSGEKEGRTPTSPSSSSRRGSEVAYDDHEEVKAKA